MATNRMEARHGLTNGGRVSSVGLAALHVGLHIGGRHQPDIMPHLLKPAPPVVRTCAGLHTDQAARALLEKRQQLTSAKLAAHENPTALVNAMNLEDALCEVDTDCSKLGHGGLLCSGRQNPDYGACDAGGRSHPSHQSRPAFAKIKHWMRMAQKRTVGDTWRHIGTLVETIYASECQNYLANAGYATVKT